MTLWIQKTAPHENTDQISIRSTIQNQTIHLNLKGRLYGDTGTISGFIFLCTTATNHLNQGSTQRLVELLKNWRVDSGTITLKKHNKVSFKKTVPTPLPLVPTSITRLFVFFFSRTPVGLQVYSSLRDIYDTMVHILHISVHYIIVFLFSFLTM